MDFGFTLKPDHTIQRTIALTRLAESAGFTYGWLFDSHVLWQEVYPLLTLMALNTERMRLGTCVTNPATREPSVTASALATLDLISDGRMDLGIGRGDSARRVLGKPPTTMKTLEEAIELIRDLVEGRTRRYEDADLHFPWTGSWKLPVWVAGLRPDGARHDRARRGRAHPPAGRPGPHQLAGGHAPGRRGIRRPGSGEHQDPGRRSRSRRTPGTRSATGCAGSRRSSATTSWTWSTSTRAEELPESLTGYIRDRTGYDYLHHAEVGSSNAGFVTDDVVDRFCIIGTPEEHIERLAELRTPASTSSTCIS